MAVRLSDLRADWPPFTTRKFSVTHFWIDSRAISIYTFPFKCSPHQVSVSHDLLRLPFAGVIKDSIWPAPISGDLLHLLPMPGAVFGDLPRFLFYHLCYFSSSFDLFLSAASKNLLLMSPFIGHNSAQYVFTRFCIFITKITIYSWVQNSPKQHINKIRFTVSQEERSVFWEVIISVILSMSYSANSFQDRAISLYIVQTSNTPCPHTSCKVHWCQRWNFRKCVILGKLYQLGHLNNKYRH
jgi:hypothetical protein